MDVPGNGVESNNENMFREEGDAESDPADVSGSDSDHIEAKKGKRGERTQYIHQNCGRKMRCGSGGGGGGGGGGWGGGGEDDRHSVLLKNKYVAITCLCFWCFSVTLFQVKCCNP